MGRGHFGPHGPPARSLAAKGSIPDNARVTHRLLKTEAMIAKAKTEKRNPASKDRVLVSLHLMFCFFLLKLEKLFC